MTTPTPLPPLPLPPVPEIRNKPNIVRPPRFCLRLERNTLDWLHRSCKQQNAVCAKRSQSPAFRRIWLHSQSIELKADLRHHAMGLLYFPMLLDRADPSANPSSSSGSSSPSRERCRTPDKILSLPFWRVISPSIRSFVVVRGFHLELLGNNKDVESYDWSVFSCDSITGRGDGKLNRRRSERCGGYRYVQLPLQRHQYPRARPHTGKISPLPCFEWQKTTRRKEVQSSSISYLVLRVLVVMPMRVG
jgi:hypothetical protein